MENYKKLIYQGNKFYAYRFEIGRKYFFTTAGTLKLARKRRDQWLKK